MSRFRGEYIEDRAYVAIARQRIADAAAQRSLFSPADSLDTRRVTS